MASSPAPSPGLYPMLDENAAALNTAPPPDPAADSSSARQTPAAPMWKAPPAPSSILPAWAQSILHRNGGRISTLPCLQTKYLPSLPLDIQGLVQLVRVPGSICAQTLVQEGRVKYHQSNGAFVAVQEGGQAIYIVCTKDRITECDSPAVQLVNVNSENCSGTTGEAITFKRQAGCITWARLTEETIKKFVQPTRGKELMMVGMAGYLPPWLSLWLGAQTCGVRCNIVLHSCTLIDMPRYTQRGMLRHRYTPH